MNSFQSENPGPEKLPIFGHLVNFLKTTNKKVFIVDPGPAPLLIFNTDASFRQPMVAKKHFPQDQLDSGIPWVYIAAHCGVNSKCS